MYELQRANMWKRISAALLDLILLVIVCVGFASAISALLHYDSYTTQIQDIRTEYAEEYGISLSLTADERAALPEEEQARYLDAEKAFQSDKEVNRLYSLVFSFTFLIIIFGVLLGYLLLELVAPLMFGNGQTIGKKIFGVGVMRIDGVKLSPLLLFVRVVLGKYTVETMIPILMLLMIFFGAMNALFGTVIIGALWLIQIGMVVATREHTPIHDKLAQTVTVDLASQKIFETVDDLKAYKLKKWADAANEK